MSDELWRKHREHTFAFKDSYRFEFKDLPGGANAGDGRGVELLLEISYTSRVIESQEKKGDKKCRLMMLSGQMAGRLES